MDAPPLISPQAPAASAPSTGTKLLAIGCHLSLFLGVGLGTLIPFVVWLVNRRTGNLVENHSRAALNFHLSLIIYFVLAWAALFFTAGFSALTSMMHGHMPVGLAGILIFLVVPTVILVALAGTIGAMVLAVIAAIRASDGEPYHYPFTLPIFG